MTAKSGLRSVASKVRKVENPRSRGGFFTPLRSSWAGNVRGAARGLPRFPRVPPSGFRDHRPPLRGRALRQSRFRRLLRNPSASSSRQVDGNLFNRLLAADSFPGLLAPWISLNGYASVLRVDFPAVLPAGDPLISVSKKGGHLNSLLGAPNW